MRIWLRSIIGREEGFSFFCLFFSKVLYTINALSFTIIWIIKRPANIVDTHGSSEKKEERRDVRDAKKN